MIIHVYDATLELRSGDPWEPAPLYFETISLCSAKPLDADADRAAILSAIEKNDPEPWSDFNMSKNRRDLTITLLRTEKAILVGEEI